MDHASHTPTVGLLHPGAMGATVGATLRAGGADVVWASDGRSDASHARARAANLRDVGDLDALVAQSDWIVSVCPPHAAEEVAHGVALRGFEGTYLDANAVAPARAEALRERIEAAGGRFVDGGIVGPPATRSGTTWLHLSGPGAEELASACAAGPLAASVVSDRVGDASALKMCYAAFTKGSTALLAAQLATARVFGVQAALEEQWERDDPGSAASAAARLRRVTAKAWRFEGEMHEISATFAAAGLPAGFHAAAADIFARLADFREQADEPTLAAVLEALTADR